MSDTATHKPIDKWIPWFFVMFFVVIACLDGIFVTLAIKTHTGVVTENAYEKGISYNHDIASAAEQRSLGWQSEIKVENDLIVARLLDDHDVPLENAAVIAKIIRPVQDGHDFELDLAEQGRGVYSSPVSFPLSGQWNVRIFVTWQDTPYQSSKTIIIP